MSSLAEHLSLSSDALLESGGESETLTDPIDTEPAIFVSSPVQFIDDDAAMDVDPLRLKRSRSIDLQVLDRLPPPGLRVSATAVSSPTDQRQGEQEIGASSYQVLANHFTLVEFSYVDLELVTNKFDDEGLLGDSLLGSVHKGYLVLDDSSKESTAVAVTRFNMDRIWKSLRWFSCTFFRRIGVKPGFMVDSPTKTPKTFEVQMDLPKLNILGCLQHPQLVKMIGYCLDDNHVFLVNEFISGRSLEDHLFGCGYQNKGCQEQHPFSWNLRLKVALQAAKGLAFLHSQKPPVIHGDVRVGNILLDQDFNAKLSGFGLVDHRWPDPFMGLGIVIAPERVYGGLSTMNDVFSFGVVLLVMLSGLRLKEIFDGEQMAEPVPEWYEMCFDEQTVRRLADKMGCPYDPDGVYILASLISSCFYSRYPARPEMTEVVECLERLCKHHQISE